MLDLRWLGICLSLKTGGELVQQVSLCEGFPFILLKPPLLLLPETMLWTRRTAGGASCPLVYPLLYLLYFCIQALSFLRHLGTETARLETVFQPGLKYCEALSGRCWWPRSHPCSPWVLELYCRYPRSRQPEPAPQLAIIHPEMLTSREQQC